MDDNYMKIRLRDYFCGKNPTIDKCEKCGRGRLSSE